MRKLFILIVCLLIALPCYSLTTKEKKYLKALYQEVLTGIQNLNMEILTWIGSHPTVDLETIVYEGNDTQRKALIKSYLEEVDIPRLTADIDNHTAIAIKKTDERTVKQTWVDAN